MSVLMSNTENNILTLTLNNPASGNSITPELSKSLNEAIGALNESVRAIIITGEGKLFCSGGDLDYISQQGENTQNNVTLLGDDFGNVVTSLKKLEIPVITAINGSVAGAGVSLALAGDIALAASSAKFNLGFTKVGLSPDSAATYLLPRLVGTMRAKYLALLSESFGAEEAAQWGLISQVVEDDKLLSAAREIALKLVSMSRSSLAVTKRLIEESFYHSITEHTHIEAKLLGELAAGSDGREGVRAFIEKRAPQFR